MGNDMLTFMCFFGGVSGDFWGVDLGQLLVTPRQPVIAKQLCRMR
jgi:hypothetical protein